MGWFGSSHGPTPVVVDGSAGAIAGLAAFGVLPAQRPLLYAADLTARAAARGARARRRDRDQRLQPPRCVRRRVPGAEHRARCSTPERDRQRRRDHPRPVRARARLRDRRRATPACRSVEAPVLAGDAPVPRARAVRRDRRIVPATAWLADPTLASGKRWLQVDFKRPRRGALRRPAPLRRRRRERAPGADRRVARLPCIPGGTASRSACRRPKPARRR